MAKNYFDLTGQTAIVTGSSGGLGVQMAKALANQGCNIVCLARRKEMVDQVADEIEKEFGVKAVGIKCDITDTANVDAAVDEVMERFGRIDILINNAGITRDRIFHKMTLAEWNEVLNTNLTSMFNTCHEVFPLMRAQQYGHIVNLASGSVWGNIGQANYAAAKAGVLGFTRTLAKEGAGKNVIVNAIAPGVIETDMVRAVPPEKYEAWQKSMPMGRLGDPSELAAVASFLASDDASYVTGQCICVNGGTRM